MGNKGIIFGEEVQDQLLQGFRVGLQSPQVEQAASSAIPDVDAVSIAKIFCSLVKHHVREGGEESWCEDATLLHPVDNW